MGSYYVNTLDGVMTRVTDADLLKTRDNLGEYLHIYKQRTRLTIKLICLVKGHEFARKRKFEDKLEEELQISKKSKLAEGVKFSDLIDKPLGSVPSIMFWNDQQMELINNMKNMKHTLLMGDYGTG